MNKLLLSIAVVALAAASPAFAQTATTPSDETPSPPASPLTPTGPATNPATGEPATTPAGSSEAPGNTIVSPVEQNRLDPSAPSQERLQIDSGSSGAAVTNPDAQSSDPGAPGQTYDTIIEGAPSNNGTSTGVSGLSNSTGTSNSAMSMPAAPLMNGQTTAPGYPAPLMSPNTAYASALLSSPGMANPGLVASPATTRPATSSGSSMNTLGARSSLHSSVAIGQEAAVSAVSLFVQSALCTPA